MIEFNGYNRPIGDEQQWFVLKAFKTELVAEKIITSKTNFEVFIPKHEIMTTRHGKTILQTVPVIPSLIFVKAPYHGLEAIKPSIPHLYYSTRTLLSGAKEIIRVDEKQMRDFIFVCEEGKEQLRFYGPERINELKLGDKVRVRGGQFEGVVGRLLKCRTGKDTIITLQIEGVIAVTITIKNPDLLELLS